MKSNGKLDISVILPCRDEERALGPCLEEIEEVLNRSDYSHEVIVSDSSSDKSPQIAKQYNVKLIQHDKEGYGIAYLEGFKEARGKYLFLADPDGSYDFNEIPRFINQLEKGDDFVIGNRFKGKFDQGAMPWLHRYIGNPFLSFILKVFFGGELHDSHCGMRAIRRDCLKVLNLRTTGMEFASEMVIKVIKRGLKASELPINYHKRSGNSKLRSFSDGWRHLRFMLLYSPTFLFFIPGTILFLLGLVSMVWLYFGTPTFLGVRLFYHPSFLSSVLLMFGYQMIIFALFARTYAITHLGEQSDIFESLYRYITIEKASIAGILLAVLGGIIYASIFFQWVNSGFGELQEVQSSVIALTLIMLGTQTIVSSFMLSILGIKEKE